MMGLANLALLSGERSSLKVLVICKEKGHSLASDPTSIFTLTYPHLSQVLGPISQALHHAPQYLDGLPTVCILHVLRLANLDSAGKFIIYLFIFQCIFHKNLVKYVSRSGHFNHFFVKEFVH